LATEEATVFQWNREKNTGTIPFKNKKLTKMNKGDTRTNGAPGCFKRRRIKPEINNVMLRNVRVAMTGKARIPAPVPGGSSE
jgi:hypothetical protein